MEKKNCPFGEYLRELIKGAGMTQTEFYTAIGIKKPYFYDILSGRINPPPYELQFKAIQILNLDETSAKQFFDLAAKGRGEIPADIAKWISNNPDAITDIRNNMSQSK